MPTQSIIIERKGGYVDRIRSYTIRVDGKPCGKISANSRLEIPVESGVHKVSAHIDWCRSPVVEIHVSTQEKPVINVSNTYGFLLAGFDVLFRWHKYLTLKPTT